MKTKYNNHITGSFFCSRQRRVVRMPQACNVREGKVGRKQPIGLNGLQWSLIASVFIASLPQPHKRLFVCLRVTLSQAVIA